MSVLLPTLVLGVLAASCVMFLPITDVPTFTSNSTYWLVFSCIVLAGPILLLAVTTTLILFSVHLNYSILLHFSLHTRPAFCPVS